MPTAKSTGPRDALRLLWRTSEPTRPGPKPGLGLDRIVWTAVEISDREGLAALTMRRVAAELGVGPASLYTYVPGRQELVALMLDIVAGDGTLPRTFPGGWREQVHAWAQEDWIGFHQHPWVLRVVTDRTLPGPGLLRWYDSALAVFDGIDLTEQEKVTTIETVNAYVRGLAWASVEDRSAEPTTELSDAEWSDQRAAGLGELVDFDHFPRVRRAFRAGSIPMTGDSFEDGLRQLLDGVEARITARRPGAGPE